MKIIARAVNLLVLLSFTSAHAWDLDFGEANSFNLFVKNTANLYVSDAESRVAANSLLSNGYDIGACLNNQYANAGTTDCSFAQGGVGASLYAQQFVEQNFANTYTGANQVNESFFSDSFSHLSALSENLSKLTSDLSLNNQWGDLVVPDTSSLLNERGFFVTNITLNELQSAWQLNASGLAQGQQLVVNVDAQGASNLNGLNLFGAGANQIVYNFYNAENLTFDWGNMEGTILAVNADFTHNQGLLTGRVITESYTTNPNGGTQLNYVGDFVPQGTEVNDSQTDVMAPPVFIILSLGCLFIFLRGQRRTIHTTQLA